LGPPTGVRPINPIIYSIIDHHFSRYDKARQIKEKQDAYCSAALAGQWTGLGEYPEDLQWEALVDVLRGRVRVLRFPVFVGSSHSESFLILRFKHTVTKPSTWMT
jgi:hypothetical protein